MKKAMAMALGAVLVAGSAAPASAASQVDFSGFYGAHYAVNGNLGYTGDDNLNETFFESRFQINVNFQATDEVSVHWRLRAPSSTRWGTRSIGGESHDHSFYSRYYYGQVVQDWGTVRVGRLAGGLGDEFGLSSLGYAPSLDSAFTYIAPFEGSYEHDSIQFAKNWENGFGLVATYSKLSSWGVRNISHYGSDHDADRYQVQGAYTWDGGGGALNLVYVRDASADGGPTGDVASAADKTNIWFINPAIMHSWGAFSVHFEGMFGFGETTFNKDALRRTVDDQDVGGEGFYLDFDYNYGPGRVNLAGWWVSGNDVGDEDDNSRVDIVNGNFYPLVVAYGPVNSYYNGPSTDARRNATNGAVGVANQGGSFLTGINTILPNGIGIASGAVFGTPGTPAGGTINPITGVWTPVAAVPGVPGIVDLARNQNARANGNTNHWALMLSGQHAFTDEITFNYALAYLALNNPNYRVADSFRILVGAQAGGTHYTTQDKDLGFEIDLGVNVQLLDNLAFTSTFGYMFTGDAYKQLEGYRVSGTAVDYTAKAKWEDADNAYSWLNSLTFSF